MDGYGGGEWDLDVDKNYKRKSFIFKVDFEKLMTRWVGIF